MVYLAKHKRTVRGTRAHKTFSEKTAEKKRKKNSEQRSSRRGRSAESEIQTGVEEQIEITRVEAKYLVPKVETWVETDSVKDVKGRVKTWLSLKYPVHLIGPTGC